MKKALCILMVALAAACGPKKVSEPAQPQIGRVSVPSAISDPGQKLEYILMNYWHGINRAGKEEIEQSMANFITLLDQAPMPLAQKAVRNLFDVIVEADLADTTKHIYTIGTQAVCNYLYDPNSPYRNEDYYLPFALALSESERTPEDMRNAYKFEAEGCAKTPIGSIAPDFTVRTIKGTRFRLSDIQAEYTMLFFSNPGCTACKSIIDDVTSRPYIDGAISDKKLAVVNVYVDEDLKAWREYEHNYPANWHTGYDEKYLIRGEELYNLRAIPSLYLLDKDKRIIMKDAPTERVLAFLDRINR